MKIRDDLTLAAFAAANGFTIQTDSMTERGDRIAPKHFDAMGIPHDGLQFTLGAVHVWHTSRGWRVSCLQGDRFPKPTTEEFHGKLINALRAALACDQPPTARPAEAIPTGTEQAPEVARAIELARCYANAPEQWNAPAPDQMALILSAIGAEA